MNVDKLIDIYISGITDKNLSNKAKNIVQECSKQDASTQIIAIENSFEDSNCDQTKNDNILRCIEINLFAQCPTTSLWKHNVTTCNFVLKFMENCPIYRVFYNRIN